MLLDLLNTGCTRLFDAILYPLQGLAPIWGVVAVSLLSALVIVWLVGKTSNQRLVRILKSRLRGYLLEMLIFRDSNRIVLAAQIRMLASTLKLMLILLPSLAVLTVPMVLIMVQLHARYGYRPLKPGENTILKVTFADATPPERIDAELILPDGLELQSPSLRIPQQNEVDFRIGARREGHYEFAVRCGEHVVAKSLDVGALDRPLSPVRAADFWSRVFYPVEAVIPEGPIASIALNYPEREIALGTVELQWLWPFLILSILAVFPLKKLLRVEL